MRVEIDEVRCCGAGFCVKMCPEVFRVEEATRKTAVMLEPVPSGLRDACRNAVWHCPNGAVRIEEILR